MTESANSRSSILWWLVLAAMGAAGIYFGSTFRTWFSPREQFVAPPMPLHAGMSLPDVPLVTPGGEPSRLDSLVGASGGLVLLLDPECSPCERMAVEWEKRRRAGAPAAAGLVAVAEGPSERASAFRSRFDLGYPVHADTGRLLRAHGIDHFPLAAWIGGDGKVRAATFDPKIGTPPAKGRDAGR